MTLCDKGGGGILNFVTSHFKNTIKVILHVSIKLILLFFVHFNDVDFSEK